MIKKLFPLAAGLVFPTMLFAATPTPVPSPTPVRSEMTDFRAPLGSVVIYADYNGSPVKLKCNAAGYLLTMPVPTPTP